MDEVNYSKLPPDLQKKIQAWEKQNPVNRQLQILEDIATMVQELVTVVDTQKGAGAKSAKEMGSLLMDMRDKLASLDAKETPETPDYAKPVVEAITKLSRAFGISIKAIDTKPVVNVPKIDAPQVNVDLTQISSILKSDMPSAFEKAIKLIPETKIPADDYTPLLEKLDVLSAQLESIDTATRIKPQAPSTIKATNTDGTAIGTVGKLVPYSYDYISASPSTARPTTVTYKLGGSSGTTVATLTIAYSGTTSDITSVTRS